MTAAVNPRCPDAGWRLVVSDLDGTMLDENGRVSQDNRAAVAELKARGVGFTIATGRLDVMARAFISQLDVRLPIIACNGAIIRNCQTGEILYQHALLPAETRELVEWLAGAGFDYLCYTADRVYYPEGSKRVNYFHNYNQIAAETGTPPVPLTRISDDRQEIPGLALIKVLAMLPDPEKHRLMRVYLAGHPNLSGELSWADAMDITAAGTSKGNGLIRLSELLNINIAEIAAFGDNDNDISLLSTAGLGIAMENASAGAMAASRMVTASHRQSGVAAGIRNFIIPDTSTTPISQAE